MKLYVFPPAPNAAKVLLYLAEKAAAGNEIELERVSVNLIEGEHKNPEYLALMRRVHAAGSSAVQGGTRRD